MENTRKPPGKFNSRPAGKVKRPGSSTSSTRSLPKKTDKPRGTLASTNKATAAKTRQLMLGGRTSSGVGVKKVPVASSKGGKSASAPTSHTAKGGVNRRVMQTAAISASISASAYSSNTDVSSDDDGAGDTDDISVSADDQGDTASASDDYDDYDDERVVNILLGSMPRLKQKFILFRAPTRLYDEPPTVSSPYHMTYKLHKTESRLLRAVLEDNGFVESTGNDWNFCWSGGHVKPYTLQGLNEYQKVNHFPRTYEITRKDKLYKNVCKMRQIYGAKHFDFLPRTYMLPHEYNEYYADYVKDKSALWIVKPNASSRGRGIFLVNHLSQVPMDEACLISRYVSNPLLIDGFKFDMRIYVAVTCFDPLRIYMFHEGLTRFSTEKYNKSSRFVNNRFMHLTNYSINKKNEHFVQNESADQDNYGNKWSLSALRNYLRKCGVDVDSLWRHIKDICIKTLLSIESFVNSACKMFVPSRTNCFELYGFDIMVDDNLHPWLLEVNLSPSLATDSPLDMKIKSAVLADLFNLAAFRPYDRHKFRSDHQSRMTSTVRPLRQSRRTVQVTDELTNEEARVLKEAEDEYERRGGFERIYPCEDTAGYDAFFEVTRPYNSLLHQRMFGQAAGARRVQTFANAPLNSSLSLRHSRDQFSSLHIRNGHITTAQLQNGGVADSSSTMDASVDKSSEKEKDRDKEKERAQKSHSKNAPPPQHLIDTILSSHKTMLTPIQAREAFAVYLERVRGRLVRVPEGTVQDEKTRLELIERFLTRAHRRMTGSEEPLFSWTPENPPTNRGPAIALKLTEFIASYRTETITLSKSRRGRELPSDKVRIRADEFQRFLDIATEAELEELLSRFTKSTQTPDVFLGKKKSNTQSQSGGFSEEDHATHPAQARSLSRLQNERHSKLEPPLKSSHASAAAIYGEKPPKLANFQATASVYGANPAQKKSAASNVKQMTLEFSSNRETDIVKWAQEQIRDANERAAIRQFA